MVGLITAKGRARAEAELQRMIAATGQHTGCAVRTLSDEALGLYAAWVAPEGTRAAEMPFRNVGGDVAIVFDGDTYPEDRTKQPIEVLGCGGGSEGVSELVRDYEEDDCFPRKLNGLFHGLVADSSSGLALLFNDRYGMRRLYYHERRDAFYFAAEAKAILAVRPELRKFNPRALGEFLSCGCTLENRSLFEGIDVLPPASAWAFRGGQVERKGAYFHAQEWEDQEVLDPHTFYREFRDVYARCLPGYFASAREVGMSVTGGLDTRIVLAWQRPPSGTLPCYSFGSMFGETRDVAIGRRVAQAYGQSHTVIPVGSEFLQNFSSYAERAVYLTDGCADVGHAADLYVNERAAQIAPVRLTGNYGGEVLRRVRAFKPSLSGLAGFDGELRSHFETVMATYSNLINGHPLSFAVFRQAPWHHYSMFSLEQSQVTMRSPFLDNEIVKTVFRAPSEVYSSNEVSVRLIADGDPDLCRIPTDRGIRPGKRLRSSIARQLHDFTFKAEYAYDYGMPQWLAQIDHVLAPLHPERLFLGRHKFKHYRVWYRDALSNYVRQILLDPRTLRRPYLNKHIVEAIVQDHIRGDRNNTTEIHKLLTLELIARIFLDVADG